MGKILRRWQRWRGWITAAAVVAVLLTARIALGRAGGGEGFGGGGFGGGGGGGFGGGGGGGGGDGLNLLFYFLFIQYPQVGIPLALIVIAFFIYSSYKGRVGYQRGVIRRGQASMSQVQRDAALAQIKQNDPAFDQQKFFLRVADAFVRVQAAWSAQNLAPVRPFISDGVHERFGLQFNEQKAMDFRNPMDQVSVRAVQLAMLETDGAFDIATLRIDAAAIDYKVSLKDGRRLEGDSTPQPFAEYWSFLRRRGAKTLDKNGLIEGNCPNCGVSIEMNQSANCTHCGAILRSGQYDWVLCEITQESEWSVRPQEQVPGFETMSREDPQLTLAALEDRTSVMFWRRAEADRTAKADPLRKIADDAFFEQYGKKLAEARRPDGTYDYFGQCAVGGVHTLGMWSENGCDQVVIEVVWSGRRFELRPGHPPLRTEQGGVSHTLFVLERKSGTKTDSAQAISSAHCPHCGAPESIDTSNACSFCGTVLNDGTRGWVLVEMTGRITPRGRELIEKIRERSIADPIDGRRVQGNVTAVAWLVKMLAGQGALDDSTRQLLSDAAARWHVSDEQLGHMIDAARGGTLDIPTPQNVTETTAWISDLVKAAMVDGKITPQELSLLRTVVTKCGLSPFDLIQMVRKMRSDMYDEAKQHLRDQKRTG